MKGIYGISYRGVRVGELDLREEGLYLLFEASCSLVSENIYRLLVNYGEKTVDLGLMVPEGDRLRAKKRFSKSELGIRPDDSIEGELILEKELTSAVNWYKNEFFWRLFADEGLRQSAKQHDFAYVKSENGVDSLALPFKVGESFPLIQIFCLAEDRRVKGEDCIVYKLDGKGQPLL